MATKVKAHIDKSHYKTTISIGKHTLIADEPEKVGGTDQGPGALPFLAASLSACTAITLRMYADRKEWPVEDIFVEVAIERNDENKQTTIQREIKIIGDLDSKQRNRLLKIANSCPVHRTLSYDIAINSTLID